jgi:hypothetical protein
MGGQASYLVFFSLLLRAFFLKRFMGFLLGVLFHITRLRHFEILLYGSVDGSCFADDFLRVHLFGNLSENHGNENPRIKGAVFRAGTQATV